MLSISFIVLSQWRILLWSFVSIFLIGFFNNFFSLCQYFFLFLKIFILIESLPKLFHSSLIDAVIVFACRFDSLAFPNFLSFLGSQFSHYLIIFLFVVFQNLLVLFDQFFKLNLLRPFRAFFDFAVIYVLKYHLQLLFDL